MKKAGEILDINETLVHEYAKRIYGFAYSKTRDYHDAQDLSQNILVELCRIDFAAKQIADMDGYIWRVCQYTWSNFVRKSIPHWESVGTSWEMESLSVDAVMEDEIVDRLTNADLYRKLRREIMYLGRNKREVTVMFYFENMTGKEISEKLGIPASTVRWYLGESKKILKERIEKMTDSVYNPKKLTVYFSGNANSFDLAGLRNDLLMQNICIVCEKKPLTVEEIASTLCMSAAFVENRLEPLVYMNYIEKVGSNKYRTTFLVQDEDFILAVKRFELEHIPPVANALYDAVKNNLGKIREIGFVGSDLDENFLMWAFTTIAAHDYEMRNSVRFQHEIPIRGDGSRHWIDAWWNYDEMFRASDRFTPELEEYTRKSEGFGAKHSGNGKATVQQFDPSVLIGGRAPMMSHATSDLQRIYLIAKEHIDPNEHDKEIIARMAQAGYVKVEDGVPRIMIPYFTAEEYKAFRAIMDNEILTEVERNAGTSLMRDYAEYIKKYIPDYLPESEKAYRPSRFYQPNAFSYLLFREGKLAEPTEDEKRRICTVVWE